MKTFETLALRFQGQYVELLDQTRIPAEEHWLAMESVDQMFEAIHSLRVRGAPLIGVSAAVFLARYFEQGASVEALKSAAERLRSARPTAVNLMYCIDHLMAVLEKDTSAESFVAAAERLLDEDIQLCDNIGRVGAEQIEDGDGILHHCNTGGLATAGRGTALGVIQTAHEQGKNIHVYVDETRPLLQGGRLTAWELKKQGIPYTLICDNMAARLMKEGRIQKAVVGADRIAMNGDFANKTGTYSVAVACKHHGIPFFTAAPVTTLDFECADGSGIPIEERVADEVRGVSGSFGEVIWSPEDAPVYNPAFDVTPADLVSGWILDTGFYDQEMVREGHLKKLNQE